MYGTTSQVLIYPFISEDVRNLAILRSLPLQVPPAVIKGKKRVHKPSVREAQDLFLCKVVVSRHTVASKKCRF